MSLEIKNLCINVSVVPKFEKEKVDVESIRETVLKECRQLVQDVISESRDR